MTDDRREPPSEPELSTNTGAPRHLPAFPAWRAFGLGWLADRLPRRHDRDGG